jgi:hypothetical protein
VVDDSFAGNVDITSSMPAGLSVNIFREDLNDFPRVEKVGDIVALRRFKVIHEDECLLSYLIVYCIVLYCIVLYCIVLYCIVLYCIVLYCIIL